MRETTGPIIAPILSTFVAVADLANNTILKMDADLTISRDLTEKEEADLRKGLTSQLNVTTLIQDEEDAEMLLEYAFDMIKGGDNIGQVVEEVSGQSLHKSYSKNNHN